MQKGLSLPRLSGASICTVRQDMDGRGFALVDTPPFFGERLPPRFRRQRMVLPSHDKRWWRLPELAQYACWLETMLDEALPEEAVSLTSLEFRHEPSGCEDREVDRLHADGSYLRSVWTLYGPATIYRDGGIERQIPHGQTLLMTAVGRARAVGVRCTLHRRPGAGPERAVIVCSFEPRPAEPPPVSLHRNVTQASERFS
ncbi:MAG TPA: hypothetical protein VH592_07160 [Gemmataceae bacterium]